MIRCPKCQHDNPPGARFCNGCGAQTERVCAGCGQVNPSGSRFCNGCGARLGDPAPGGLEPRFSSPESYTPRHLAEKILTSKAALEGERKQVTVLFADLKGSMELLADRDPEDARKLLDPVLEHMMEAVHRFEGTVNQVMGDGIMALFGAPLAHEDHAVRACYAALRMQESVKRYAEGARRAEGITVRIRVGLNSGEVVVRAIGSDLHMDYTAVGQTTHLAARMEQLADPGTVLLTSATLALAEDFIQARPQGPTPVKGMTEPVEVYELVGAIPVRSRFHAHAARGLTTFVGRASEMTQLAEALDLARSGHGQVVAVVGEPGLGKSRLFWEFGHSHRTDGCLILESASVSYGTATTYLPVIELVRGYFQIEPRDDTRKIREKVTGKLFSLDRALEPALPPLFSLLDVPVEDGEWTRLDPVQRRQRTLDAVKRLLIRESQVQPLVVVFEDLHWVDRETQALLDGLVESLPTARLLFLVNYRPEYQHTWGNKTNYRQLHIAPLLRESADALLDGLLGSDPGLGPLRAVLIPRTAGNPFFLEETVRTLVETGVLAGETGSYRATRQLATIQIPSTVQAVIAARIDRLSPADKRVLQSAAVIGKDVPYPLLETIDSVPEPELRQTLASLQAAEFLYEARLFPELEYTFKHALTQEVAYAGLTNERRRALDTAIVTGIERLSAGRLGEHVERLAHHAFRGQAWPRAAMYLQQAATKALHAYAYRQAVSDFERALVALSHQPESRETLETLVDIKYSIANPLLLLGDPEAGLAHARDALSAAERLHDERRVALSSTRLAHSLSLLGRTVDALPFGRRAIAAAKALDEQIIYVNASTFLGAIHWLLGDFLEGQHLLEKSVELLQPHLQVGASLHPDLLQLCLRSCAWLAFDLVELGEFDRSTSIARVGARLAEASHKFYGLAQLAVPWSYLARGEAIAAIPGLEHGLSLCEPTNNLSMAVPYSGMLGRAYGLVGRSEDAVALLEEAVTTAEANNRANRALWNSFLSEAYLQAGRHHDAEQAARRGLEGARERGEKGDEAWSLLALAAVLESADPPDVEASDGHYRAAMTRGDTLGMRPLVARCHLGLGRLYRRTGRRAPAHEHLTTATTMCRDMDMRFWLEQAEVEMRELGE